MTDYYVHPDGRIAKSENIKLYMKYRALGWHTVSKEKYEALAAKQAEDNKKQTDNGVVAER